MAKTDHTVTAAALRAALHYNPDTGVFTWRPREPESVYGWWNGRYAGKPAGHLKPPGSGRARYRAIHLYGRDYLAHRIAWLYMTGRWPSGDIDHVDGDGLNYRIANLREASRSENLRKLSRPARYQGCSEGGLYMWKRKISRPDNEGWRLPLPRFVSNGGRGPCGLPRGRAGNGRRILPALIAQTCNAHQSTAWSDSKLLNPRHHVPHCIRRLRFGHRHLRP